MMGAEGNILEVQNLSIGYSAKPLFADINFSVQRNSVVAIIGMNGTGKSTLLRTVCNLQVPLAGKIFIEGKDITTYSPQTFAKTVSIVLPGRAEAVQILSVEEVLSFSRAPYTGYMHKLDKTDELKIESVVEQLGISDVLRKKIYQLSDGEAQKVFLAKALVQDTPLLFLDEPTSHLDIVNKADIFRLIKNLAREHNKTILFASHEIELSLQVAGFCLLLNKQSQYLFHRTQHMIEQNLIESFLLEGKCHFNKTKGSVELNL